MLYIYLALFSVGIIAADQISKYFVLQNIPLHSEVGFWDGIVHFTYTKNDGMAWSMLPGGRWFFVVITVIALAAIVFALKKKWVNHPTGQWALAAVAGGAVGNLIDRVRFGYVVDMIEVEFIDFPVFNVADCFIVCGAIMLLIYAFFFDKKKEIPDDDHRRQRT